MPVVHLDGKIVRERVLHGEWLAVTCRKVHLPPTPLRRANRLKLYKSCRQIYAGVQYGHNNFRC